MPRSNLRTVGTLLAVLSVSVGASADPGVAIHAAAARAPSLHRHSIYLEALGKGGVWGLGYDYRLTPRLAIGAVGSYLGLDGQRLLTFAPYVSLAPIGLRHRWFIDVGPQLVDVATPSPVPEWSGTHSTGIGGEVSSGYEYRGRVVVRVYAMAVAGGSGIAPWFGTSLGGAL
ncbi:MAG: hypothetical protein K8W52_28690 [Deltaproteobacteria bacterium]|nr:hypothetical protein [Deltaproteobacteria bacterium]